MQTLDNTLTMDMMQTEYYPCSQQQQSGYMNCYPQQQQASCMMYSYNQPDASLMMAHKRYRGDSVQLLRCRRRMDLVRLQQTFKTHPNAVARRNERERNRVKHINSTFSTLRQHLPAGAKTKKMSKVDTLKSAIRYIKHLQQILDTQCDDVTSTDCPTSPVSSVRSESATVSTCHTDSPVQSPGTSPCQDNVSRDLLTPGDDSLSQDTHYHSDDTSYDTFDNAGEDLSDLVHWLQ